MSQKKALVLFAHGSRDPNWRVPFEAILAEVKAQYSDLATLAFLESMQPSLDKGIANMVDSGATSVHIVPLFLAVGSHLKHDMPLLIEQARQAHPTITITTSKAIGEDSDMQNVIAKFAIKTAKLD